MKHSSTRRIVSTLLAIPILGLALIAWFYIDISYADQSFGFYNYDANPMLHFWLGTLDATATIALIGLLLWWGWIRRATPTIKRPVSAKKASSSAKRRRR